LLRKISAWQHAIAVATADATDRKSELLALERATASLHSVQNVWTDSGYIGKPFAQSVESLLGGGAIPRLAGKVPAVVEEL
jgi:hypothetical protein